MMKSLLLALILFATAIGFGQVTENYQMQTGNFNSTHTTNTDSNYFAGTFNHNNNTELGTFANGSGDPFPGNPGVAAFRTLTVDGSDENSTARSMQLGDSFTITGFVSNSSSFFGGGTAGVSFNASTNNSSFSDYETNTRIQLQINQNGNWFIDGTTNTANGFSTPGTDATLTFKLNAPNRATVTLTGTNGATTHDVELGNSGSIESFVIWNQTSGNNMFWKNASLEATGELELGTSNSSFIISDVLSDGLDANSSTSSRTNNLIKNGTGNVTLSGANTYSGTTTINNGSLILGDAGVIHNASNLILNGGKLTSGSSTGFSETLGTLTVDDNSSIDLGTGSHTLTFADSSSETWAGAAVLTINNWTGTAGTSGSGTAGTINVGASGLTSTQLSQIQFDGFPQGAVITSSGEVVPEFEAFPATNASNLMFDNIGRTRMDISWTNGDGDNRIVFLKANSAVDASPVSGTSYTADNAFGSGDEIGTGNFVVYNGNDNPGSVTVTGLTAGTTYHVEIFEYNGSGGGESYRTPGLTDSQATTTDYLTDASGILNWNTATDWLDDAVPPSGASVVIRSNMTLDINATVSDITITTGNSLTSESGQGRTLTIQDGGSFINDGSFNANDGTVSFPGSGTITANAPTTFNDVDIAGGVDFGSGSTIDGTLTINAGGFANTNAPTYGASSSLVFATGGPYTINNTTTLWTTGGTLGQGVPNNVQVTTTNPLNIFEARDVTGNLTINSGASVVQGNNPFIIQGDFENSGNYSFVSDGAQRLIVEGNFINNNAASFELSNAIGGDLEVLENFTDNGSFTANGRAVFFTGSNSQTVTSATDPLTIDFIVIDKSANNVQMLQNLDLPNNLEMTNGNLDLNGNTLTISGDIRPNDGNGTIIGNASGSTLIFDDQSTARTLELDDLANNTIANLTIDESGGVSVNTDLTVTGTFDINAGDNIMSSTSVLDINNATLDVASGASFTFKSDDSGSAQLADATGATINDDVTVERFIPVQTQDTRAFRFLTSAVNSTDPIYDNWQESGNSPSGFGTHITGNNDGTNGVDQTATGNPSMYTFDNQNANGGGQDDDWEAVTDTKENDLKAGEAYRIFIRGDRNYDLASNPANAPNTDVTLRATGTLVTGNQTFNLSQVQDYYSLVGNPYQAIVDMSQVTSTNINSNFYYVWDPNKSTRGGYESVSLPGGTNPGTSDANEFVMPGQSFFVQTLNGGPADITFTESSKEVSATSTAVFSEDNQTSINLLLYKTADLDNGDYESDALGINFSADANNAVDQFDADKFPNPDENLARSHSGDLLSIENRNMPTDNESLALFTSGYTVDNYTFVVNLSYLPTDVDTYLVDHYTGDQTLLNDGSNQISFSVDQNIPGSIATDRFSIDFEIDTFGLDDQTLSSNFKVYPNPVDHAEVNVQIPNMEGEAHISLYNIMGQRVMSNTSTFDNGATSLNIGNHAGGVYFLEVNQANESLKKQIIIK